MDLSFISSSLLHVKASFQPNPTPDISSFNPIKFMTINSVNSTKSAMSPQESEQSVRLSRLRSRSGPNSLSPSPVRPFPALDPNWLWLSQWLPLPKGQTRPQTRTATTGRTTIRFFVILSVSILVLCLLGFSFDYGGWGRVSNPSQPRVHTSIRSRNRLFQGFRGYGVCYTPFQKGRGVDLEDFGILMGTEREERKDDTGRFCATRKELLEAMSGANKEHRACAYHWFNTAEICLILRRFDALVFIGDDAARRIYAAFNILLRKDISLGAWKDWEMEMVDKITCRCAAMFALGKGDVGPLKECGRFLLTGTDQLPEGLDPYICNNVPHLYTPAWPASGSVMPDEAFESEFKGLMYNRPAPWKPSPMIFSLGTTDGVKPVWLTRWVALASGAMRNVPILVVGPEDQLSRKWDGSEAWIHVTTQLEKEDGIEILHIWNLTSKTKGLGRPGLVGLAAREDMMLVEAMMVINWLSKLETS